MPHRTERVPGPGVPTPAVVVPAGRPGERGPGTGGLGAGSGAGPVTGDVGAFHRGDPITRALLARYLVARTIGDGVVRALLVVAFAAIALTLVLAFVRAPTVVTVLVGLVALAWVVAWRLARALWRRLGGAGPLASVGPELDRLVRATRPGMRRALRDAGLPAHPLAGLTVGLRLLGRRRAATVERMRRVDVDAAVPAGRVDDLDLLLARVRSVPPTRG